jgi:hypothetical protein
MSSMPKASTASATPAQIELALAALREITTVESIGEFLASRLEAGGTMTLRFENKLAGYPGWQWNVSLALLPDAEPTVLEAELIPDEGALLAPDWVPWSVRLAEFLEAQKLAAEAGLAIEEDVPEGLLELAEDNLSADEIDEVAEVLAEDASDDDDDFDDDDDDDDEDDDDESDDDEESDDDYPAVRDNVHSGDIDGVELDEDAFN